MTRSIPSTMRAAAIERFGGPEVFHIERLPVPKPDEDEILVRVEAAGVGVWDPEERQGELASRRARFPMIIGSDGAGTVVAVGGRVRKFKRGDRVYAYGFQNPKGGFYAEYAAVKAANAARIPRNLSVDEAGALAVDGLVALEGLEDHLRLKKGESLVVFGASGGAGHLAVQLAKRMGVRVVAIASGADGVDLTRKLGADQALDGHRKDLVEQARAASPGGFDAALIFAGGPQADAIVSLVRKGGRVAYPNGVEPVPRVPKGVKRIAFDGLPSSERFDRLNRLIAKEPFHVNLDEVFPLQQVAKAHRKITRHHLGKVALRPSA